MENYLDTHIQNTGQYQTMINGNVIDKTKWSLAYDGDELDLEAKHNDEAVYMKLNKDELLKLFEVPAYHKTIGQRLEDNLAEKNDIDIYCSSKYLLDFIYHIIDFRNFCLK